MNIIKKYPKILIGLSCMLLQLSACASSMRTSNVEPLYHQINRGESLFSISSNFSTTPDEILELNGLRYASSLRVGQKILVGYRYLNEQKRARIQPSMSTPSPVSARGQRVHFTGGRLLWPLEKPARFVSGFGPRNSKFHDGIDLAAPEGTHVLAAHDGIVAYAGDDLSGYGKVIVIQGEDKIITVYAHNSRVFVSKGDSIDQGDKIALVGATGRASGPHLHFEMRTKDSLGRAVAFDPVPLLTDSVDKPGYRFNSKLEPLLAWLNVD